MIHYHQCINDQLTYIGTAVIILVNNAKQKQPGVVKMGTVKQSKINAITEYNYNW